MVSANSLLRRRRKSCGCLSSAGEYAIESYLSGRYSYIRQFSFPNCKNQRVLPFDFCIQANDRKFLVEYQGKQHYTECGFWESLERTQKNDEIKVCYCQNENIPLLVIPYTCKDVGALIEEFINESSKHKI